MKKTKKLLGIYPLIFFLIFMVGCGSGKAKKVHQEIKVDMSANEVVNILANNEGRHSYWLKLCSDWENWEDCQEKMCESKEFIKIASDITDKKVDSSVYVARINVLFMGPGYMKNDFKIYFNRKGNVKSITPVKSWD